MLQNGRMAETLNAAAKEKLPILFVVTPAPSTRNPKPETRNPEPETRHPTPDTRHPKPET